MPCIGRDSPTTLTPNVAIICRLSATPLTGTCLLPLKWNKYFPGETQHKGVWSKFMTRSDGISSSWMAFAIAFWKVNFSSARSWADGSTLPVVDLLFEQFRLFKTLLAQPSVSVIVPPRFLSIYVLYILITPFPMFINCCLSMTPPDIPAPKAISFTFTNKVSSSMFGLPAFL